MDIAGISGSALDLKELREALRGKNGEESILEQFPADMLKVQTDIQIEEKDYAKATLVGMQAHHTQLNQQNAALNAAMAEVSASGSYAMRNLAGKRAARRFAEDMQRQVAEESQRNLKENRNAIEERAQQAVAGQTTAPAAPMPEQIVVAASVVPAPAPAEAPAPPTGAPEVPVTAEGPVTPSVNITV